MQISRVSRKIYHEHNVLLEHQFGMASRVMLNDWRVVLKCDWQLPQMLLLPYCRNQRNATIGVKLARWVCLVLTWVVQLLVSCQICLQYCHWMCFRSFDDVRWSQINSKHSSIKLSWTNQFACKMFEAFYSFPFLVLEVPNLKIKQPTWIHQPSAMTMFSIVLLSYFLVTGGNCDIRADH